ncbi:MAG: GNAT family N-acetyltransferase [Pseudomonadota bacterium]
MKITDKVRSLKSSLLEKGQERKRLKRAAQLQFAIADSLNMLNTEVWKNLTHQCSFFMSADYLKAMEPVLPTNISPRYALIYQENDGVLQPIAAVYVHIIDIHLAHARPEQKAMSLWKKPVHLLSKKVSQRVLTCGNLLTYGQHGIAFAEGIDPKIVWHGVAEVLYRLRQADRLRGKTQFLMIKDLHAPFTEHALHLSRLNYRYLETEPNMVLTLGQDWKSYDDYLASLSSKYRANIRNGVLKPIDEADCVIEQAADLTSLQDQFFTLYQSVQANAAFRPFLLRTEYFSALQRVAGERFRCSLIKRNHTLLGFLISVADGDTSIAYHIGFDRSAAAELPLYFRLLHAGIADALALGCKRISFGRSALEPKAALGAKPETFGVLVRHRQPILNTLLKRLLLGIEHEEAPDRNPFKKVS